MSDLISRQAAIDALQKEINKGIPPFDDVMGSIRCGVRLARNIIEDLPSAQPHWIPCSERLPSKEECKEWIDNNCDGIGYLYPCLVTRYSSFDSDRAKNNPYVAKHYFDGEDFVNAGEQVCSEYIVAWKPLPEPYKGEYHEND